MANNKKNMSSTMKASAFTVGAGAPSRECPKCK